MQTIYGIVRTLSAPRPRDITPDELRQELSDCSVKGVCSPVVQALFEEISISTIHAAILNKELDPRQLLLAAKAISAKSETLEWLEDYCHA